MDIHQNARLTQRSREALALYVLAEGFTRKAAAAAAEIFILWSLLLWFSRMWVTQPRLLCQ